MSGSQGTSTPRPTPRAGHVAVELSVDTVEGAVAADRLGADRIELCAAGALGGLTPSHGTLAAVLGRCRQAEIHALIRPREGGFVFGTAEIEAMVTDVEIAVAAGAAGVVVGALTARGTVDVAAVLALVAAADGRQVTFHRALDVCADPRAAVETLAGLGVARVLSSGARRRAEDGAPLLGELAVRAAGRVEVMACGGIRPHNVAGVLRATGVRAVHAAPRRAAPAAPPGPSADVDYGAHAVLDEPAAAALIAAVRAYEG